MSMSGSTADLLAIEIGAQEKPRPLPTWPAFQEEHLQAVETVLRSGKINYWTGTECRQFEAEYARSLGAKHAIALANGTVALELALYAIDLQPGDEVIVPSHTFVATASAVLARGGIPVFADVEGTTQNVSAETLEPLLTSRTRAIIVVHMGGRPCEMDEIYELAQAAGVKLIEDCAQAHGACYRDRPVGTCSDISAFSFCQDKIITTGGEGGLVVTNDETLFRLAWSYKDHGKNYDKITNGPHNGLFRPLHDTPGTNWRLTEMQAALGRVSLALLPEWVETRRAHAETYKSSLLDHPAIEIASVPSHLHHSYYKFYCTIVPDRLHDGWSRDLVLQALQAEGVPCGSGSCAEIYTEKMFQTLHLAPRVRLPSAQHFGERSLMFLTHPTLKTSDVIWMTEKIQQVLNVATSRAPQRMAREVRAA
ncbi:MAG: DegT/DnrJ/EryC1/StrS family aminotransferase [Planctomycetaceae bacterium]|nr:DegT/DnrJ/EryC1/StrS family aminotransferase [Planctomycetaceae bacterium]